MKEISRPEIQITNRLIIISLGDRGLPVTYENYLTCQNQYPPYWSGMGGSQPFYGVLQTLNLSLGSRLGGIIDWIPCYTCQLDWQYPSATGQNQRHQ